MSDDLLARKDEQDLKNDPAFADAFRTAMRRGYLTSPQIDECIEAGKNWSRVRMERMKMREETRIHG